MAKIYSIHPAIGFGRVGTSPDTFLGPELPGALAGPGDGVFRDVNGLLKRQAVRFRIFETDTDTGAAPKEIQIGQGATKIEWTVHLVNAKAEWFKFDGVVGEGSGGYPAGHPRRNAGVANRRTLIIDPLPRTLTATGAAASVELAKGGSVTPAQESWPPALTPANIESLGTLAVDADGRLQVAGGFGRSGSDQPLPASGELKYDNNDHWFDDVADGPVTARVTLADGTVAAIDTPAWMIVAPPDYAPGIENIVTAYDLLFDLALREFDADPSIFANGAFVAAFKPSFTRHVLPMLRRALAYPFVIQAAGSHMSGGLFDFAVLGAAPEAGEDPDNNARTPVFARMRDPDNIEGDTLRDMPMLHNDGIGGVAPESRKFTITRFQFFVLKQWAAGRFLADGTGTPTPAETIITPAGLDRAALEAACGGSFFPGMESGWILRDPRVYATPWAFRFRHADEPNGLRPGSATKRMALPWQADFLKCGSFWWPAQRPNQVRVGTATKRWDRPLNGTNGHVQLVKVWSKLGFVVPDPANPGRFVEDHRTLSET